MAIVATATAAAEDGLRPGEVLNAATWERARGLLPDELLAHYRQGEFENPVAALDESRYALDEEREVWEVEAIPRDRYYLYGRILLRFDTKLFRGTYNSKYDWRGQIMQVYSPCTPFGRTPDGRKFYPYLATVDGVTFGENLKLNRATSGGNQKEFWEDLGLPFETEPFDTQQLVTGK